MLGSTNSGSSRRSTITLRTPSSLSGAPTAPLELASNASANESRRKASPLTSKDRHMGALQLKLNRSS